MGKALMGTYATPRSIELLEEVRALRERVAQLERALADAEQAAERREPAVVTIEDASEAVSVAERERTPVQA